ncbi:hypothetical protein RHDC4_00985 [Rhodocyclaceae bacterium]|nr:hypothetical protein RHDC4_00985 [Rhodocyclaceae bacterium]
MEVEHLAHWKQAMAFVLWGIEALCIVAIYISFSWPVVVASIFILVAAEALYQLLRKFRQGGYS